LEAKKMKLVYRGVTYEYNPPEVVYPTSSTSDAAKEQDRALMVAQRRAVKNRERCMLMRLMQNKIGLNEALAD
jgi:hypothetical protein